MRRRRGNGGAVLLGAGVAAGAAATVAGALRTGRLPLSRRRRGAGHRTWRCSCGERLRSAGQGRHQIHWRAGAPDDEPLLDGRCPGCGRALSA